MNGIRRSRGSLRRAAPFSTFIFLFAAGCGQQAPRPPEAIRPVKTTVVTAGGKTHVRIFPGKAEATKRVELAFQVPGLLVEFPVKEGQEVKKGELIGRLRQVDFEKPLKERKAQLDRARAALQALRSGERPEQQRRLDAAVRAAEAKLSNARTEFERNRRLFTQRSVAREEVDRSETNFRLAQEEFQAAREAREKGTVAREEDLAAKEAEVRGLEARVVEANIQLQDSTLRAPYDGKIAQRFVEQNQNVTAKQPIVKFQDPEELEVVVDVPETFMADLRRADIVEIAAEFPGASGLQIPVHIQEIAQRADPVTQTFQVRAALLTPPNANLLPGMTATVTLTYRRARILGDRVSVPISAVFKDASGEQVWIVDSEQTVSRREVKLGEASGGQIEIVSGLEPGERIAVAGVTQLSEGMKVRDLGDALGGGQS
jgi:RND family efflux transporter MFP subunit